MIQKINDIEAQELKALAEANIHLFLQVDGSGKGYICPKCGSGSGRKGTGLHLDPKDPTQTHYKCFACGLYADVLELGGGIPAVKDALYKAGLLKNKSDTKMTHDTHYTQNTHNTLNTQKPHNAQDTQDNDNIRKTLEIKATIKEAEKHLTETNYFTQRGISQKTAERFHCGYIEQWRNPKAPTMIPASPRIIIPTSDTSYLARDTRENLTEQQKQYSKQKVGAVQLFNADALFALDTPCFITEGEIDALSVLEMGYNACALGGVANTEKLAETVQGKTCTHLILYLDSDKAGQDCDIKLQSALTALGLSHTTITGKDTHKDANDFLRADRASFSVFLAEAQTEAKNALEAEKNEYIKANNVAGYVDSFLSDNEKRAQTPCTKTGFFALDKALDGGLYEGLYILGAVSSVGKTTFILQVADQISQAGQDVLFFSLEQSRYELIAKSISRETAQICENEGQPLKTNAKTIRGITDTSRYDKYTSGEIETLTRAISNYKSKAQNLYIFEGLGDIGVQDIKDAVEKHIRATGKRPIVFIDYLQIMQAPDDKNRTDKQIVDTNISSLKKLSRDLKLTIVGISSFNRDSYSAGVNMASFKESGAIEYSSDVLIGLQFTDIDYTKQTDSGKQSIRDQLEEAKKADPRKITAKILKNRNGALGDVDFEYYPAYNLYKPVAKW